MDWEKVSKSKRSSKVSADVNHQRERKMLSGKSCGPSEYHVEL